MTIRINIDDTDLVAGFIRRKAEEPVRFSQIIRESDAFRMPELIYRRDDIVLRNVLSAETVWCGLFGEGYSYLGHRERILIGKALRFMCREYGDWELWGRLRSPFLFDPHPQVYVRQGKCARREFCSLDFNSSAREMLGEEVELGESGVVTTGLRDDDKYEFREPLDISF